MTKQDKNIYTRYYSVRNVTLQNKQGRVELENKGFMVVIQDIGGWSYIRRRLSKAIDEKVLTATSMISTGI